MTFLGVSHLSVSSFSRNHVTGLNSAKGLEAAQLYTAPRCGNCPKCFNPKFSRKSFSKSVQALKIRLRFSQFVLQFVRFFQAPTGRCGPHTSCARCPSSRRPWDPHGSHKPVINGGFHQWGVPQNGWFERENPMKMDDLGVPIFQETSKWTTCLKLTD